MSLPRCEKDRRVAHEYGEQGRPAKTGTMKWEICSYPFILLMEEIRRSPVDMANICKYLILYRVGYILGGAGSLPSTVGSMYGIFTYIQYIYSKNQPNVGRYSLHESCGIPFWGIQAGS